MWTEPAHEDAKHEVHRERPPHLQREGAPDAFGEKADEVPQLREGIPERPLVETAPPAQHGIHQAPLVKVVRPIHTAHATHAPRLMLGSIKPPLSPTRLFLFSSLSSLPHTLVNINRAINE